MQMQERWRALYGPDAAPRDSEASPCAKAADFPRDLIDYCASHWLNVAVEFDAVSDYDYFGGDVVGDGVVDDAMNYQAETCILVASRHPAKSPLWVCPCTTKMMQCQLLRTRECEIIEILKGNDKMLTKRINSKAAR